MPNANGGRVAAAAIPVTGMEPFRHSCLSIPGPALQRRRLHVVPPTRRNKCRAASRFAKHIDEKYQHEQPNENENAERYAQQESVGALANDFNHRTR